MTKSGTKTAKKVKRKNEASSKNEKVEVELQPLPPVSISAGRGKVRIKELPGDWLASIFPEPTLEIQFPEDFVKPKNAVVASPVKYSGYITYTDHGRNDRSADFSVNGTPVQCRLDLNQLMVGGRLHITIEIPLRSSNGTTQIKTMPYEGSIIGMNPDLPAVKAALGSLEMQVIAYKESRFRQFDPDFLPLFGPPRGFGLMQIDTPIPTYRQIWDWRENIKAGIALFEQKRKEVTQHFMNVRKAQPGAPELTEEQFLLAMFQYYNGGYYWAWNTGKSSWEKVDTTGYGDDALRIYKLVKSGNPPKDWG